MPFGHVKNELLRGFVLFAISSKIQGLSPYKISSKLQMLLAPGGEIMGHEKDCKCFGCVVGGWRAPPDADAKVEKFHRDLGERLRVINLSFSERLEAVLSKVKP